MAAVKRFEDSDAWKMARELVNSVYDLLEREAFERDFGLKDQISRCSVFVMSNIAEGFERGTHKDLARFLFIAKGSCGEIRSQLYVALDRNYITPGEFKIAVEKAVFTS